MAAEIHVGDVGTEFRGQVRDQDGVIVPTNAATVLRFYFRKPDKTLVFMVASPGSSQRPGLTGADGWMHYVTDADDLNQAGAWKGEGYMEIGPGKWATDKFEFYVHPRV